MLPASVQTGRFLCEQTPAASTPTSSPFSETLICVAKEEIHVFWKKKKSSVFFPFVFIVLVNSWKKVLVESFTWTFLKKQGFTLSTVRDEEEEEEKNTTITLLTENYGPVLPAYFSASAVKCITVPWCLTTAMRQGREEEVKKVPSFPPKPTEQKQPPLEWRYLPCCRKPCFSCIPAWVCGHSKQTQFWMGSQKKKDSKRK